MLLYFRLVVGVLRRSIRGRRDLLVEHLVLRQQLAVYAHQRRRPRAPKRRPHLLVGHRSHVVSVAVPRPNRPAGDRGPLAPHRVAPLLDAEEPRPTARTAADRR